MHESDLIMHPVIEAWDVIAESNGSSCSSALESKTKTKPPLFRPRLYYLLHQPLITSHHLEHVSTEDPFEPQCSQSANDARHGRRLSA
jgi:hypothetical protein